MAQSTEGRLAFNFRGTGLFQIVFLNERTRTSSTSMKKCDNHFHKTFSVMKGHAGLARRPYLTLVDEKSLVWTWSNTLGEVETNLFSCNK